MLHKCVEVETLLSLPVRLCFFNLHWQCFHLFMFMSLNVFWEKSVKVVCGISIMVL